ERNPTAAKKERPEAMLTDNTGKAYAQLEVLAAGVVDKERKASVFPVATVDEVLAFAKPARAVESLRLELPAAAWGGAGVFRFTIPRAMIGQESGARVRPTVVPGG